MIHCSVNFTHAQRIVYLQVLYSKSLYFLKDVKEVK